MEIKRKCLFDSEIAPKGVQKTGEYLYN